MVDRAEGAAACSICQFMQDLDPKAVLWEDEYWICAPLLDVPGWTLVMTRRHAEGIWALSDEEAVRFGPMMRDITNVVKQVTGAERVHYAAMGEVALHYHNAILPRLPGQKPVWDSLDMVARAQKDADPQESSRTEAILRERLGKLAPRPTSVSVLSGQHA